MSAGDHARPGLLGRLLSRQDHGDFAADLDELLPNYAVTDTIADSQVAYFLYTYRERLDVPSVAAAITGKLLDLAGSATSTQLRRDQGERLLRLAASMTVPAHKVHDKLQSTASMHFVRAFERTAVRLVLSESDRAMLNDLGAALGLSDARVTELWRDSVQPIVHHRLVQALDDNRLSPAEEESIHELARNLGIARLETDPDTERALALARTRWRLSQGELPIADSPLMLKRGETCHAVVRATAFEDRSRTVRSGYSGVAVRIKIVKGVYYNAGSYRNTRTTEAYSHRLGEGYFVVTNKRVLFSSDTKNVAFALDSIADWTLYSDGVELRRTTGKPVTYIFTGNSGLFLEILVAARLASIR